MQIQVQRSGDLSLSGKKPNPAANFANSRRFFNPFATIRVTPAPGAGAGVRGKEKDFAYTLS